MISVGWVCVLLAAVTADSGNPVYKKVGDEVVLQPKTVSVPGAITSIIWKHGPNLAAQWDGSTVFRYRQFKERGSLNTSTGEMTITGLTREDSGDYTPEINNKVFDATRLVVMSAVPVPSIITSCEDENTCKFTCKGNITGAQPVTYKWKLDGNVFTESVKEQTIKKEDSLDIKEISCRLENKVSQESSQPIDNPFITEPESKPKIYTGLIVFIVLLVPVVLLAVIHKCITGMWFYQKESMPWEAAFWRKRERRAKGIINSRKRGETNGDTNGDTNEETLSM